MTLRACSDQQKYSTLVYRAWVALINPETVIPLDGDCEKDRQKERDQGREKVNRLGESQ